MTRGLVRMVWTKRGVVPDRCVARRRGRRALVKTRAGRRRRGHARRRRRVRVERLSQVQRGVRAGRRVVIRDLQQWKSALRIRGAPAKWSHPVLGRRLDSLIVLQDKHVVKRKLIPRQLRDALEKIRALFRVVAPAMTQVQGTLMSRKFVHCATCFFS